MLHFLLAQTKELPTTILHYGENLVCARFNSDRSTSTLSIMTFEGEKN